MGLDMYLFESEKEDITFDDIGNIEELVYWRKANAIHNWFVVNVQNYKDDCEIYPVSKEKLEELLHACKEVLDDYTKAEELLPTKGGSFFGSTLYSDYYFDNIIFTMNNLMKILNKKDLKNLYYWSSW